MQAYAARLIDLIELKAENIAKQWADDVMKHDRTPSYHFLPQDMVIAQGINFYRLFRRMSLAENPYEEAKTFSWIYAENLYRKKIPLQEAIYALMLMRRNLWLYAEFQGTFITALEKQQAVESLNRTILMFDYVSYQVTEKYQELTSSEVEKILHAVKTLMMKGCIGGENSIYKSGIITIFLVAAFFITFYYHSVLRTEVVFTHLFYIPIVLGLGLLRQKRHLRSHFSWRFDFNQPRDFLKRNTVHRRYYSRFNVCCGRWDHRLAYGRH